MDAASKLFDSLRRCRTDPTPRKSPEKALIDYCEDSLGGLERIHFDFKEKSDRTTPSLGDADKKNLAKAVSGFANGGGGVLIWGIKDDTMGPCPIKNVSRFVDSILETAHQIADPSVPNIDGDYIPADANDEDGFAIIHIPESPLPPHRVILNLQKLKDHYYFRTGSSFVVATHSQLEDMFGRRPRPDLELVYECRPGTTPDQVSVLLSIHNRGRGIAKYPFVSFAVTPPNGMCKYGIDGNGTFGLPLMDKGRIVGRGDSRLYDAMKFGSRDGYVIHSGVTHAVTRAVATIASGNPTNFVVDYTMAAEGLALQTGNLTVEAAELMRVEDARR